MFSGYTQGTFEFFMALQFNNNREFFQEEHDWYLRDVREPSLQLAAALSETVEAIDPNFERRPNRVVSRINRDLRFSLDKTPYNTDIFLGFKPMGKHASETLMLYFDISAREGALYGMGLHGYNRAVTDDMRRRIAEDPEGLLRALEPLGNDFSLYLTHYKRMGVPEHIPEALRGFYTVKGFYAQKTITNTDLVNSPALVDELKQGFMRLAPLYRFFQGNTKNESR